MAYSRSRASPDRDTYVNKSTVASKLELKRTAAGRGWSGVTPHKAGSERRVGVVEYEAAAKMCGQNGVRRMSANKDIRKGQARNESAYATIRFRR